jgi:hypothetical protein
MSKQQITQAIAAYAQATGLTRFTIRASRELTAKAITYVRERADAAIAARKETTPMTTVADRFTDEIQETWDNADCYLDTAEKGLSETDAETLAAYCDESGDDYATAEAEVMAFVRRRAAEIRRKQNVA